MVTIRRLTPKHAKAAFELRLAALREAPSAFGSSYEEEKDIPLAVIEERLVEMPDSGYFGAFAGEQLVGIVVLGREKLTKLSHKSLIWGMVVAPEARGAGVGRALLQAAIAFARSVPGIRQVKLAVNAENTAAIRLYQSLGFEAFGRERSSICVDGQIHDEVHMSLHFPEEGIMPATVSPPAVEPRTAAALKEALDWARAHPPGDAEVDEVLQRLRDDAR